MQEKNIFATFPKDKLSTAGVSQLPYLPKLRIKPGFNSKKTHFHSQNITYIVPLSINVHFTVVYIYYDYNQFLNMVYQVRKKHYMLMALNICIYLLKLKNVAWWKLKNFLCT